MQWKKTWYITNAMLFYECYESHLWAIASYCDCLYVLRLRKTDTFNTININNLVMRILFGGLRWTNENAKKYKIQTLRNIAAS